MSAGSGSGCLPRRFAYPARVSCILRRLIVGCLPRRFAYPARGRRHDLPSRSGVYLGGSPTRKGRSPDKRLLRGVSTSAVRLPRKGLAKARRPTPTGQASPASVISTRTAPCGGGLSPFSGASGAHRPCSAAKAEAENVDCRVHVPIETVTASPAVVDAVRRLAGVAMSATRAILRGVSGVHGNESSTGPILPCRRALRAICPTLASKSRGSGRSWRRRSCPAPPLFP